MGLTLCYVDIDPETKQSTRNHPQNIDFILLLPEKPQNAQKSTECHLPLQEVDIFDNKLEFSEIKIAIGQGFR